jgi:hypothetical protein
MQFQRYQYNIPFPILGFIPFVLDLLSVFRGVLRKAPDVRRIGYPTRRFLYDHRLDATKMAHLGPHFLVLLLIWRRPRFRCDD